ncbi:hypothetical protein LEP1GSC045_0266 [Leptospira interrogans serovar Pomona str. Kennewicki LC82-25]|nr:hypothetical protein LEP1GSC045_0266 [Leptospira interrogans serovar Pomona str. Kennewicki LC82-25]EMN95973.1 hypothetical protein LEP1GSC110_0967 [Leptospira interrogans serovar Medanensis str. UT053]
MLLIFITKHCFDVKYWVFIMNLSQNLKMWELTQKFNNIRIA